jgi:hypothetical protein
MAVPCCEHISSYPGLKPGATRCIAPTELDAVVQFRGFAIDLAVALFTLYHVASLFLCINIYNYFIYKLYGVNINEEGVLTSGFAKH